MTADGQFSLEEVECIGACSWAPAIQVNYDFHHNVTPEKLDQLIDEPAEDCSNAMLYNEPSPLEVKVLTRRFGLPNSQSLDTYLATDGLQGVPQGARDDAGSRSSTR